MQLSTLISILLLSASFVAANPQGRVIAKTTKPLCTKTCPDGTLYDSCVDYIQDPCTGHYCEATCPDETPYNPCLESFADQCLSHQFPPRCTAWCPDGTKYNSCLKYKLDPCLKHQKDCKGPDYRIHCSAVDKWYLCNVRYFRDPCALSTAYEATDTAPAAASAA